MSKFECWMIFLTALAILVAGLTGAAIYWQAQIGAETLKEIKKGGDDTHTLAESSKKQAENTARQLPLAEAQARAAQDSVKAIQRQMRQDQRAWMNIELAFLPWTVINLLRLKWSWLTRARLQQKHVNGRAFVEKVLTSQTPHFGTSGSPFRYRNHGAQHTCEWLGIPKQGFHVPNRHPRT